MLSDNKGGIQQKVETTKTSQDQQAKHIISVEVQGNVHTTSGLSKQMNRNNEVNVTKN